MKFEVKLSKSAKSKAFYKKATEAWEAGKKVAYKDGNYPVYYCGKTKEGFVVGLVQEANAPFDMIVEEDEPAEDAGPRHLPLEEEKEN